MTNSSFESSAGPLRQLIGRPPNDEISLAELFQKIRFGLLLFWARRRFVVACVIASVGLGQLVALGSRTEYTATLRILPYHASAGAGTAGIAGLLAGRLTQAGGDQTITVDLYPEVAGTSDFLLQLANTPLRFSGYSEPITASRYFTELVRPSAADLIRRYTIGLPGMVLSAVPSKDTPSLAEETRASSSKDTIGRPAIFRFDDASRAAVGSVAGRLSITSEVKGKGIVSISATMPDPLAAADLALVASGQLMDWVIEYEAKKAFEQLRFLEQKFGEAEARLKTIQNERARFAERNRGTISPRLQLEADRLQREYAIAEATFQRFASGVEEARIKKSEDTPVFTVLEQVKVPESPSSPKWGRILMLSLLLGLLCSTAVIAVQEVVARSSAVHSSEE